MAGQARFTAVLDACVLFPIATADALISLAVAGLFAAKWTVAIEAEWLAVAERRHPGLAGRFTNRRDAMRDAVIDWEVPTKGWEALAPSLTLPDPNDVHVLAAAIAGHADCIVTTNLKDFPASVLDIYGLIALHPDDSIAVIQPRGCHNTPRTLVERLQSPGPGWRSRPCSGSSSDRLARLEAVAR